MSGATSPTHWTYDEYARLPDDGKRYEVLDGEVLVTPAPGTSHQRIATRLFVQLWEYVRAQGIGEMMWDIDLLFVSGQFLRPDMLYVRTRSDPGWSSGEWRARRAWWSKSVRHHRSGSIA